MLVSEFAEQVLPGVHYEPELRQAAIVVRERPDAMTYRIFEGKVECLNGQAQRGLESVKDHPERHGAFVLAMIYSAQKTGRKMVLRVREDGGRVQFSPVYPDKK